MSWYALSHQNDAQLDELASRYSLSPLHIDDCREGNQRATGEATAGYLFVVLKPVTKDQEGEIAFSDLTVFLGPDFLITVADGDCKASQDALARATRAKTEERPARLLYLIYDTIVDSYLTAIDRYDDRVDELEDKVLDRPSPQVLEEIFGLKRSLIALRRVLVNTRDLGIHLQREPGSLIDQDLWPFFRDVYDHVARHLDSVEMLRDLLGNTLDVYLSSVANRTNEVMKVLTVLSTIALPSIMISGIYGMNLKGIPFLDSPMGIWIVMGLMVATTVGLLLFLKRLRWL